MSQESVYLTVAEFAAASGLPVLRVTALCVIGDIPSRLLGRRRLIHRDELGRLEKVLEKWTKDGAKP